MEVAMGSSFVLGLSLKAICIKDFKPGHMCYKKCYYFYFSPFPLHTTDGGGNDNPGYADIQGQIFSHFGPCCKMFCIVTYYLI